MVRRVVLIVVAAVVVGDCKRGPTEPDPASSGLPMLAVGGVEGLKDAAGGATGLQVRIVALDPPVGATVPSGATFSLTAEVFRPEGSPPGGFSFMLADGPGLNAARESFLGGVSAQPGWSTFTFGPRPFFSADLWPYPYLTVDYGSGPSGPAPVWITFRTGYAYNR